MDDAAIVYVHGLWWSGRESGLLRRRLTAWSGCPTYVFGYSSMRERLDEVAARLRRFLDAVHDARVPPVLLGTGPLRIHLLGHSLGGLIILHCLRHHPWAVPGRVVFMGTPTNGSQVARNLSRGRIGRGLLGPVLPAALLDEHARWDLDRPLGLIAGSCPFGLGRLVVEFDGRNDGTVSVAETRLQGAAAHRTLPVTHMGMLLSARVAREVWSFFEQGRFD